MTNNHETDPPPQDTDDWLVSGTPEEEPAAGRRAERIFAGTLPSGGDPDGDDGYGDGGDGATGQPSMAA